MRSERTTHAQVCGTLTRQLAQPTRSQCHEIAHARRRFGYRRIYDMLCSSLPRREPHKVYRHYSAANLAVRKRKKIKRPANERVPLQLVGTVNGNSPLKAVIDG